MKKIPVEKKFKAIFLVIVLLTTMVLNFLPVSAKKNRYLSLERISGTNPELNLYINEKSLNLDLLKTKNIRLRIKARDLYSSIDRISSFKISVFEIENSQRKFIASQQLSIFKGYRKSRIISLSAGEFTTNTKNLEFEVYNTQGQLINTYKATIAATNIDSQFNSNIGTELNEVNCDSNTFGECQLDYLLQRIHFEAKPQRQASTRVIKTNDGFYKVTIPFPRTRFKFLGRSINRQPSDSSSSGTTNTGDNSGGNNGDSTSINGAELGGYGETVYASIISLGNSAIEQQFIKYDTNGNLNFNNNMFLDLEGKLGIGVSTPTAWLHIRNGDETTPSLKLNSGPLTTTPQDGAIEYDGENFYITVGTTRSIIGANNSNSTSIYSNQNVLYDNNSIVSFINGSYIENLEVNGSALFNKDSTVKINGKLLIKDGENGQVLTYVNGEALWRNNTGVQSNGSTIINNLTEVYNNGTSIYNDSEINYNNVTENYTDSVTNYSNQSILYENSEIINNNGATIFTNGAILFNQTELNFLDTTINKTNVEENYYDSSRNFDNQTDLYNNGSITYNNGTVINFANGSFIENIEVNGKALFNENSSLKVNGTFSVAGGSVGDVLTQDINGNISWNTLASDNWTDIGTALHPSDSSGVQDIILGGTNSSTADVEIKADGGVTFNKQLNNTNFEFKNITGESFTIFGENGNVSLVTSGLSTKNTLELKDQSAAVNLSMKAYGSATGPVIRADNNGLTINGETAITLNVDGGNRELYVNGDTVSIGTNEGKSTLNIDGSMSVMGTSIQSITAGSGIIANRSNVKIVGDSGAITITANPQINFTGDKQDGQLLILRGTDDTNTVTIVEGNGVILDSGLDFTLGQNDILELIFDTGEDAWIEITRSDK